MKRVIALIAVLAAALALLSTGGSPAGAQSGARIHLIHGIPDTPVDVVAGGEVVFSDFDFQDTQDLSALAGQTLAGLQVRLAGTDTVAIDAGDVTLPASGNVSIIANLDAWKKLDARQRDFLQKAVVETERKAHTFFQEESKREEQKLFAAGMKDLQPSAAEGRKYAAAAHNSLWEQLGKRLSNTEVDDLRRHFYKE